MGLICFISLGQAPGNDLPPFKKNPTLPPLELLQPNNKMIRNKDIGASPVVLIYFSPTCEHCIAQMKELKPHLRALKYSQVIMATYQPMDELKEFIRQYGLEKYHYIRAGRDIKFLLPPFFKMNTMPYLALYDKKGRLITTFEGNTKMSLILEALKK